MSSSADPRRALRAFFGRGTGAVQRAAWLTALGWWALLVGALALVAGWRLGWDELLVLGTALVVLVVLAHLLSLGRPNLAVAIELRPSRVVVGDRAAGAAMVRNSGRRAMLPLRIELPVGLGVAQFDLPPLAHDATHELAFVIPTSRRAVVDVGPVRSVRGDMLNLVRREVRWGASSRLYIHPRTVDLSTLSAGWLRDLEGHSTNDLSPSDLAFHTLREYVPGDDRRHIHWRTSARVGTLMVRQFVDTRRSHLAIVLSDRASDYAHADEFELAVSVAASLGRRVLSEGHDVTCVVGRDTVPAVTVASLLDALAGIEVRRTGLDIAAAASGARDRVQAASIVALIAGAPAGLGAFRLGAERISGTARAVALRIDETGVAAMQQSDQMLAATVPTLDALRTVLWAVSRQ